MRKTITRNELARPKPWPKREGLGYELSFFDGGSGLANKEGLARTPIATQARLSIRTGDVNPFRTQLSVDGLTEAQMRDAAVSGGQRRIYRQRTKTYPAPPPPRRARRTVRTTPQKRAVTTTRRYGSRLPKPYPSQRLSQPWQPTNRPISRIPAVKILGGATHGMGLRPMHAQPIQTVRANLEKLRFSFRRAVSQIRARR